MCNNRESRRRVGSTFFSLRASAPTSGKTQESRVQHEVGRADARSLKEASKSCEAAGHTYTGRLAPHSEAAVPSRLSRPAGASSSEKSHDLEVLPQTEGGQPLM